MGVSVFIYSNQPLDCVRGELEDDLDELLGSAGECTGAGEGQSGWNIDLEIFDANEVTDWVERIRRFLEAYPVPADTYCQIVPSEHDADVENRTVMVYAES